MGLFQNVLYALSPDYALKREVSKYRLGKLKEFKVMNSGYSEGGASRSKNSLKGFSGESKSPFEDIDKNLHLLRQRSRLLYMQSPIATSAIKNNRTNIIGSGLKLKSRIDFGYLGISQEAADEWERNTEREFNLWAESQFCDIKQLDNFYELQNIALIGWLLNGDSFAVTKYVNDIPNTPYKLRIQLIEADRVSTPGSNKGNGLIKKLESGNTVYNGVEINKDGTVLAYHISNNYPGSYMSGISNNWVRVADRGRRTGNVNIIHVMDGERAEQYRGVPYLAPVIESLKQITRYTEAELMAAVINGFFTVFIECESGNADDIDFAGAIDDSDMISGVDDYQMGPGMINILKKGEKATAIDPKRPNVNFDGFVTAMCKHIGAALEMPYESLLKCFNSSYSASRASLIEAGKAYKMRRSWFSHDFCQPIYELWLADAVAMGRIKAPGFFSNPLSRKSWCRAEWNGPAQGQIDPVKEVDAAERRVKNGFSTRERETIELTGGDFDRNIEQLKLENERMSELEGSGLGEVLGS